MAERDAKELQSKVADVQRLDKWLWFARVVKSRTQAAGLVSEGHVRINRIKVDKPSQAVRPGDVLTIGLRGRVRILEVLGGGARRGPPAEAAALFNDLSPPPPPKIEQAETGRDRGTGRPTKKDRRDTDRLKGGNERDY